MRASFMEVDLTTFKDNVRKIQDFVGEGTTLIPVIKANAYGTYVNKNIDAIKDFKIVAVAMVIEAIELRKIGFKGEILILNQPDILDIDHIIEYNITIGLSSIPFLKEISSRKEIFKVHLEIETGMGRTGIRIEEISNFCDFIKKSKNIKVEGVYTHFAVADTDEEYTNLQIEIFNNALKEIKTYFKDLKYIHTSASNGILNFKNVECNSVRPGIIMYGYEPFKGAFENIKLNPIATLKSRINFVKTLKAGESVSYGRTFIADKNMIVATVPLGYADGIRRDMSGCYVVVKGKRAKIIGKVCMDSFMIDITDIADVKVEDFVYIWDNNIVKLDEIAEKCDTINYEIITCISNRVPRKFI